MKRSSILLCAVIGSLLVAASASAEVYKYKDRQGRIHFSDRPQAGWTPVEVKAPNAAAAPVSSEAADRQARRAAECLNKKHQLENYKTATRVMEKDALGRDREYTVEEKQKLIALTQQQVSELCSPAVASEPVAPEPVAGPTESDDAANLPDPVSDQVEADGDEG